MDCVYKYKDKNLTKYCLIFLNKTDVICNKYMDTIFLKTLFK